MNAEALLVALNKDQLVYEASPLVAWELGAAKTIDDVAEYMYKGGRYPPQASVKSPPVFGPDRRPPKSYWDYVKREFHVFLCSPGQTYSELWNRLGKIEKPSYDSNRGRDISLHGQQARYRGRSHFRLRSSLPIRCAQNR